MTGTKETGATWHRTTVILRSDIYREALTQEIDIGDTCNRALANATGIDYLQQQIETVPPALPVIIARNGSPLQPQGGSGNVPLLQLHPVINADDPAAPARVVQANVQPIKKPVPETPAPLPSAKPATHPAAAPGKTPASHARKTSSMKKPKGDALRTFFTSKIARTDDKEEGVGKDELYELFARFCRDRRIIPVPERKSVTIALKNQFALQEKLVNGRPCWTGIRLK